MIQAVFFDIGGTVHTQDATPESDRDYIRRLWCFLHMNHIYTAETPEQLLEHINAGAKAYKSYTEQELIELPPDVIWQKFFLKDFDVPAENLRDWARSSATCSTDTASTSSNARG